MEDLTLNCQQERERGTLICDIGMSISDNALYESYNLGNVVCHPHVYSWRKNLDKLTKTRQIRMNVSVI